MCHHCTAKTFDRCAEATAGCGLSMVVGPAALTTAIAAFANARAVAVGVAKTASAATAIFTSMAGCLTAAPAISLPFNAKQTHKHAPLKGHWIHSACWHFAFQPFAQGAGFFVSCGRCLACVWQWQ